MVVPKSTLDQLALSSDEYDLIVERLGREPNFLELGIFGSLWSEHCAYKHSKPLLKLFSSHNPEVLVGAGEENAGAIDIGDGLAVVMKIESHNHPSAIEPYEGAATGVGGIIRDIFAMGARPIALLNSLRFGPITNSRNRYIFNGVVSGISGYGNCIGIPNVGGEIVFDESYTGNPLVNAMCVGLVSKDRIVRATTATAGNIIMLVGAQTGRDGIHGASGLASRSFEDERELRPTVQVGNPFLEKVLLEACLEIAQTDYVEGIQDLGAAGLTSAAFEAASNGNTGISLDLDRVPRREANMEPYEVMLSESQERMLIIVKPGYENKVKDIFDRWDLDARVIGRATNDGIASLFENGKIRGTLPIRLLNDPPVYRLHGTKPRWLEKTERYDLDSVPLPEVKPEQVMLNILSSPNIASKHSVYRRYDHQVQTNTILSPGGDAAVLRVKGTSKGLALTTDGNGRYCYLDPYMGGMISIAEACRNLSCTGARPIALTNCLNFGNPEKLDIYYQLEECIKGMAKASKVLGVPIISGNVSLYNESQGTSIYPTPIIGGLGLMDDVSKNISIGFLESGDEVVLLGCNDLYGDSSWFSGSEYIELTNSLTVGKPHIDIEYEALVQKACRRLILDGIIKSAHDCSDGGLAVAIAESCMEGQIGFQGEFSGNGRWDVALFGEQQSRIVVSLSNHHKRSFSEICNELGVDWIRLGVVAGNRLIIDGLLDISVEDLRRTWHNALGRMVTPSQGNLA